LNAEAFLQLAEPDWLKWSHDKVSTLGVADCLCHITYTLTKMANLCLIFKTY